MRLGLGSFRASVVALLALVAASGCSSGGGTPRASLVVIPSANLHDGQQIQVSVRGFPHLGEKVFLSECATAGAVNGLVCGDQLAGQTFLFTDDRGSASGSFVVHASAAAGPFSSPSAGCSSKCVLMATLGAPPGTRTVTTYQRLTFGSG